MNWDQLLNNNRIRQSKGRAPQDARNDFESDFGRITFSPATRRMHDKTQVFPLTSDDNIHSRLTHSMEVMAVGYSMGVKLCEDAYFVQRVGRSALDLTRIIPVLIKNSCLVHDIGNPPFGHFGESVIKDYFKKLFANNIVLPPNQDPTQEQTNSGKKIFHLTDKQKNDFLFFDGNAQGLRVLTKLQMLNDDVGLNLTYGTLASYIKYPNIDVPDKTKIAKKKIGIFHSEIEYFEKIVEACDLRVNNEIVRHPLCYLMEAADSICYLTMDIEDAYSKGLITLDYYYKILKEIPSISEKINEIYKDEDDYYKNDITKIVNFRIHIIWKLVELAINNFLNKIDEIEAGEFNEELIFLDENNLAKILQDICSSKILTSKDVNSLEMTGFSVMRGLLDYYVEFLFHEDSKFRSRAEALVSKSLLEISFEENGLSGDNKKFANLNDYYKLRIIVDFISGMTDQFALNHFQKISGQKII